MIKSRRTSGWDKQTGHGNSKYHYFDSPGYSLCEGQYLRDLRTAKDGYEIGERDRCVRCARLLEKS